MSDPFGEFDCVRLIEPKFWGSVKQGNARFVNRSKGSPSKNDRNEFGRFESETWIFGIDYL